MVVDAVGELYPADARDVEGLLARLARRSMMFAISFCRRADLLSQWKGYGGVAGFALGFDPSTWGTVRPPTSGTAGTSTTTRQRPGGERRSWSGPSARTASAARTGPRVPTRAATRSQTGVGVSIVGFIAATCQVRAWSCRGL